MPIIELNNVCTSIQLVNRARSQAIGIVLDGNSMSHFRKVYNLANNYNNLFSNGFKHSFVYTSSQSYVITLIYFFKTISINSARLI